LLMAIAPMLYWWTGASVIAGTGVDLLYWLGPSVVASGLFMWFYAQRRVIPVMTDITQLVSALAVVRTVAVGLVRPFGHPFKVTAKGLLSDTITIQWALFVPFALAALGTFAGIMVNLSPASPLFAGTGYAVNIVWSIFNIAVLLLSAAVCVELPKVGYHSFPSTEGASIVLPDGKIATCTLAEISLSGATLTPTAEAWPQIAGSGILRLNGGALAARFTHAYQTRTQLKVSFEQDRQVRRALIAKLYTGDYRNDVMETNVQGIAAALVAKLAR
jgi:cellulose synthase (UDP-forming)